MVGLLCTQRKLTQLSHIDSNTSTSALFIPPLPPDEPETHMDIFRVLSDN
jgi:hypothetical protein